MPSNSTMSKARGKLSLTYWLGPTQHLGDGSSTDPATRWNEPKPGTKRQQGEEAGGKPRVDIVD